MLGNSANSKLAARNKEINLHTGKLKTEKSKHHNKQKNKE